MSATWTCEICGADVLGSFCECYCEYKISLENELAERNEQVSYYQQLIDEIIVAIGTKGLHESEIIGEIILLTEYKKMYLDLCDRL